MKEIWKDIKGYEGLYQVSNLGRVKSLSHLKRTWRGGEYMTKEKILTPQWNGNYYHHCLCKEKTQKMFLLHRLVGIAFIPNPKNKPVINHKFGNTKLNTVNDLEWATVKENLDHAINELGVVLGGEKHHSAKLREEDVKEIRYLYATGCFSSVKLSKMYNVAKPAILAVVKHRTWKHVKV